MPFTKTSMAFQNSTGSLSKTDQQQLITIARQVIAQGCTGKQWTPCATEYSEPLQQPAACFVTLQKQDQLRGCMGSLEPHRPLVEEIASDAWSAAFRDPRFAAVSESELALIQIELSILSPMQPLDFSDRDDLMKQLRSGVDGLLIESGMHRATFLPQVWQQLPTPREFLNHLMKKAGLNPDQWPADMQASCYQVSHFSEADNSTSGSGAN